MPTRLNGTYGGRSTALQRAAILRKPQVECTLIPDLAYSLDKPFFGEQPNDLRGHHWVCSTAPRKFDLGHSRLSPNIFKAGQEQELHRRQLEQGKHAALLALPVILQVPEEKTGRFSGLPVVVAEMMVTHRPIHRNTYGRPFYMRAF